MKIRQQALLFFNLFAAYGSQQVAAGITVENAADLRRELDRAKPGSVITLAAGAYGNGLWIENLNGTKAGPIVISGEDKENPPIFSGGNEAIHFSDCSYVTLRNIRVSGCAGNGINADDGGSFESPSVGMVFENIKIENIGPKGNFDGLKLSGLVDFAVRNCTFAGWGGSAIDMVAVGMASLKNRRSSGKTDIRRHPASRPKAAPSAC